VVPLTKRERKRERESSEPKVHNKYAWQAHLWWSQKTKILLGYSMIPEGERETERERERETTREVECCQPI